MSYSDAAFKKKYIKIELFLQAMFICYDFEKRSSDKSRN